MGLLVQDDQLSGLIVDDPQMAGFRGVPEGLLTDAEDDVEDYESDDVVQLGRVRG
jgi:hypothetical protein